MSELENRGRASNIRSNSSSPIPTTSPSPPGCGCVVSAVSGGAAAATATATVEPDEITISITPTTGGQFDLTVDRSETIENLKKIISRRLKVAKERICLLHLERQLRDGTLEENRLQDGSRLTLLPSVETGLLAQRPEQSVMQALESLNDSQVNDFLSGKAPLNLTMRLGDHMMLIQLQLSTVRVPLPGGSNQTNGSGTGLTVGGGSNSGGNGSANLSTNHVSPSLQSRRSTVLAARSTTSTSTKLQRGSAAALCSSRATTAFSATNCSNTRALAEASRNLTQKLKQLSSEENARHRQGAMIESMHHHGKGVYSGTFSGTINPALQDRHGRPKRDISTIIHILNDLLCATPAATTGHYRHHHRHSNSRQQCPSGSSNGVPTSGNGATVGVGCRDSNTPGHSLEELSKENEATKGKMRRLRLVMEQRRSKRKARREARAAPHATQWAAMTPDPISNHDASATTASSSSSNSNPTESQNEPELQPCSPEPVVA
ncbi:hypothetical protein KPH14_010860 [Odynerus spinipes]|uniref:Ubiquitin-like domain-containing protein n=1 Tax=Odynerus spinipes TaxID=1348599 RepID=A0AAD9RHV7_9HYME|nr:hypothetical protein KPH14_010860 [Odynerus spinipes]